MHRLIQISDPHLSPRHGFFHGNFERVTEAVNRLAPDLVVSSGDLTVNGPEAPDDLAFARWCHDRIAAPVLFLPGNHDVGEEPGGEHLHQPISASRLEAWIAHFGRHRWRAELGRWRLLGVNSQLFNSELPEEAEQWTWLEAALGDRGGPVGVFLHKPLYEHDPTLPPDPRNTASPVALDRLERLFRDGGVRFVASGHRHQRRILRIGGIDHVWCPSTAFMPSEPVPGCDPSLGLLEFTFDGDGYAVAFHAPEGLTPHVLGPLKENGRYPFLKDVPPRPVAIPWC
jgi:3',5'-cyclic AMP phosphodiesterase CpdA